MTITYRLVKGSRLTNAEVDDNFRTINDQYAIVSPAIATIDGKVGEASASAFNAANSASSASSSAATASNAAVTAQNQAAASAASAADALVSEANALSSASTAQGASNTASAFATAAGVSASESAASAESAFDDRVLAQTAALTALFHANSAKDSANDAQQAYLDTIYQSVINSRFFSTYSDAVVALPSLQPQDTFAVLADETRSGRRTYYRVDDSAFTDPSLFIDFMSGYEDLSQVDGAGFSSDFINATYSSFQQPQNVQGIGAFSAGYPYTYIGADSINLLDNAPTTSASAGLRGDFAISGNNLDFHNGTQWVRLTGVTF